MTELQHIKKEALALRNIADQLLERVDKMTEPPAPRQRRNLKNARRQKYREYLLSGTKQTKP